MIRPGPPRILPGLCPGGFVVHAYGTADGRLLVVGHVTPEDVEALATAHAEAVELLLHEDEAVCLVTYDGDSGERLVPPGYATGDRL